MNEAAEGRECLGLCEKLLSMLEQDSKGLSLSLKGDALDAYRAVTEKETDKLRNVRALLRSAIDQLEQQ
ncbi:MAG: hypothetical protein IKR85_02420 [Clostridia bacterium]|nr:hypothetical protein [Clostridia bacterium]